MAVQQKKKEKKGERWRSPQNTSEFNPIAVSQASKVYKASKSDAIYRLFVLDDVKRRQKNVK